MTEAGLEEVARVLGREDDERYGDADVLLDRARADADLMFRSQRFLYALYRARLASRRGQRDEAAAFARGALWQAADDEAAPQFSRHPDVGRVAVDKRTLNELEGYAEAGDAERYTSLADDYRSPTNGHVQWHWSLIERLRPNAEWR